MIKRHPEHKGGCAVVAVTLFALAAALVGLSIAAIYTSSQPATSPVSDAHVAGIACPTDRAEYVPFVICDDGIYTVGVDVAAGTYMVEARAPGKLCMWSVSDRGGMFLDSGRSTELSAFADERQVVLPDGGLVVSKGGCRWLSRGVLGFVRRK